MRQINGDVPLTLELRQAYFSMARRELAEHRRKGAGCALLDVTDGLVEVDDKVASGSSPLRIYTDIVLIDAIRRYCPEQAYVLDLGCGRGEYVALFENSGRSGTYVGVDVRRSPHWERWTSRQNARFPASYIELPAEALTRRLGPASFDFCISSSSLEHIEDDEQALRELASVMRPGAVGVHIVPSPWSMYLYGTHGWRRYPLERLQRIFSNAGFQIEAIHALGGTPSFLLHFLWITLLEYGYAFDIVSGARLPTRLSARLARWHVPGARSSPLMLRVYRRLLTAAIRLDRVCPKRTIGYAVIARKPI